MRKYLEEMCEGIDAAVFSGDVLYSDDERKELAEYIARWSNAIGEHEAIAAAEQAQQAEPVNQQRAGVYRKFNVSRTDGRDQPGGDRHGAEYFVLDVTHDKFAKAALAAYAAACRGDYPSLADDMVRRYGIAQQQAEPVAHPCWSCGRLVTAERRATADGDCPNCGAELDLEDWPAAAQKGSQ